MTTLKQPLLLDEVLPHYDVSSCHSIRVYAPPERIYHILHSGFPVGTVTKVLMAMRRIPRLFRRTQELSLPENPFYKLKQLENKEVVVGIIGQFWRPVASPVPIQSLQEFLDFTQEGFCKAAMNLRIIPDPGGRVCVVTTETRVIAYGSARDRFRHYWRLIAPFSGLIRREILRKIKEKAENP